MTTAKIRLAGFGGAAASVRTGSIPWTIFAFPAVLADERQLPRDEEALRYFDALRREGLPIGVWSHPRIKDTIYFACPYEARDRVQSVVEDLERSGEFPANFAAQQTERLLAMDANGAQPFVEPVAPVEF